MTRDQPSRLDRIEVMLERMQQQYDNERQLIAELRTRQEVQNNQLATIGNQLSEVRSALDSLLQIALIHQQGLERLTTEFRQHRSDGHGA